MPVSQFFKGVGWLVLLNLIIKPIWIFGIDRQVQNVVGHEEYGTYFSIFNLSLILAFIADAGITNLVNREVATGGQINVARLFYTKCFLSLLYSGCLISIAWLTGVTRWEMVVLIAFIQLLTSFLLFFRGLLTANQLFQTDAWISVIDKFLMIGIVGTLLYFPTGDGSLSLPLFLGIQMACTLLTVMIAFAYLPAGTFKGKGGKSPDAKGLQAAFPFVVIILLMSIHNRLDGFILERLHPNGAFEAGVYASAYRLLDAGNMVGFLSASFLLPYMARHLGHRTRVEQVVLLFRHLLLLFGVAAVAFVIVFSAETEELLYHTANPYFAAVLVLVISALPAYLLTHVYGSVLTAQGELALFASVVGVCAGLNSALNLFFVQAYGAFACSIAALISQYLCGAALYLFASKRAGLALHASSLFTYLAVGVVLLALFYYGQKNQLPVYVLLMIGGIITALSMFVQTKEVRKKVTPSIF